MTTCYKLTNQDNKTFGGCKWGEGVTHETSGEGGLCGPGWLHAYSNPLLAVFLNPIHAKIKNHKLWECIGDGRCLDDRGLKCGFTRLTTVKEISLPEVTTEQRVAFAILCAKEVYKDPEWSAWANEWLSGKDRTRESARAAARAAAREDLSPGAAADAAEQSAWTAVGAADAVVWAAEVSAWAARAADLAANSEADIDLVRIAKKAMEY